MYEIKTLQTLFYVVVIIIVIIFFILAILRDKRTQKEIKKEIELKEDEVYYECLEESKKDNKDINECIKEVNQEESRTRDIIELNLKNISLTKRMINSSLEGAIRGGIFGFIISKYEGAFVGILLFATLNPLMKYIQSICTLQQNLI